MIKVENEIKVYEINGVGIDAKGCNLLVTSHWNENSKIVIRIDGKNYTVVASDLRAAIDNATNVGRY